MRHKRAQNPGQTLTGSYIALEKLRANEALNAKEKQIHHYDSDSGGRARKTA
jgi:hypothetical protein